MGLFPSNFVQVLDASFQPVSRVSSPMPGSAAGSLTKPSPQKSKTFRKPFQAYARAGSPNPAAAAANINSTATAPSPVPSRQSSSLQAPSKSPSRRPSYLEKDSNPSRQPSYLKMSESPTRQASHLQNSFDPTRRFSYLEQSSRPSSSGHDTSYASRAPSPAPPAHYQPSPEPDFQDHDEEGGSSPPPPPPPHRVAYNAPFPRVSPSPTPSVNDRYPTASRGSSPAPPSPGVHGHTPSPLRDAMDDVMSSLHDMTMRRNASSPSPEQEEAPLDPWSPEAFEELRTQPNPRSGRRPRSSLGIVSSQRDTEQYRDDDGSGIYNDDEGPPQVQDYVERMEGRLRSMGATSPRPPDELFLPDDPMGPPPAPPPKNSPHQPRTQSSLGMRESVSGSIKSSHRLKNRKSAYELGRSMLDRTFTTKSSATNSSSGVQSVATNGTSSTQRTSQSIMSGYSAGAFSATSAGSLARRKWGSISRSRPLSVVDGQQDAPLSRSGRGSATRPQTPSHYSSNQSRPGSGAGMTYPENLVDSGGILGGLTTPKSKKSGFFKKLVESAKTGAASARSSIAAGQADTPRSPIKNLLPNGVTAIAGGNAARDMGLGGGKTDIDWVQVRRDVNRSNSLSRNERSERIERCQMMDYPVVAPVDSLLEAAEGDEGADGMPVRYPTDFQTANLQLVDKSARFVNSLPPMTSPASLAQGYVCRPYRSEVQKLRAIFTWVSEKVAWEEDFEGEVDSRRVIQMRRGCSKEVAVLVSEMCSSVGLHAEIVRGYLKSPGETLAGDSNPGPNHWWNAVVVDDCWRVMDCSLASPTNPKRGGYSSTGSQIAENGFFLTRPLEICYTHIPSNFEQQHICPPIAPDVLLALPCACPPYFRNNVEMIDYDTSLLRIENLELVHLQFTVPADIECVAEVESISYARDADGDVFESGDTTTNRALAQAEWVKGQKRYTIKALLPGDVGHGTLKVYTGQRGLMHSIKDNPHPLAFSLPIVHTGINPPYDFLLRHPTPHAQRHDLYVAQPQCARLAINNTFVFAVRQHPSFLSCNSPGPRSASPNPFARPSSAMSMMSTATSANDYFSQAGSSSSTSSQQQKPAKLAIQAPSGKILRLLKKSDNSVRVNEAIDGSVWETIIKIGERGTWRGLVLADRSARWCVFGEWEAV
ncbi:cytokinesis protein 3 [Imshaugia aleurites]|uniref:Cytokinesis protein 3 n=1 Tax=Imshaugia aleurites TaxID=172621 RepID=A0A8H3IQV8_9LECA|nr:cytokinesis protein 3 [Imshaugia aleurites]